MLDHELFRPMPWADEALCAGRTTEDFYPSGRDGNKTTEYVRARDLCSVCPVADECLDHALTIRDDHGLWGGVPPRVRRRLARMPRDRAIEEGRLIRAKWSKPRVARRPVLDR